MGRIKTQLVKRLSLDAVEKHKDKLSTDFDENKSVVAELMVGCSKKVRNIVAGYVTRLMKTEEL